MNGRRRVGTCSVCGGDVVGVRGAWFSVLPPPPDTCSSCGGVAASDVVPVVPMVPRPSSPYRKIRTTYSRARLSTGAVTVFALLMIVAATAAGPYTSLNVPDSCAIAAMVLESTTPQGLVDLMRNVSGGATVKAEVVRTDDATLTDRHGRPCEITLIDIRLNGERVLAIDGSRYVIDERTWYRRWWSR